MLSRSRVLSIVCAAILLPALAATAADAAVRTGKYAGKTSQSLTVRLTLKNKGKRVNFSIPYGKETQCTGNSTFVAGNTALGKQVHVKKDGTFSFTFSSQQPVTINGQAGATDRYTYTATGKFKGKKVTGTFQERDDIYDANSAFYGSCQTTGVTYTAKWQKPKH